MHNTRYLITIVYFTFQLLWKVHTVYHSQFALQSFYWPSLTITYKKTKNCEVIFSEY